MDKKIDLSTHRGDAGIALIHMRTSQMGFIWHDRSVDAGIDGSIEVRNPATGEMTNKHLFVQSKASGLRFSGENDRSFHYNCDNRDIDYWMKSDVPVLLICSHPDAEQAWWAHVQGWFCDPVRRASGRIDFDKATQSFDANAVSRLLSLADPHADAHTVTPEHRPEQLLSNLLPVTVPHLIFSSPVAASSPGEVYKAMQCPQDQVRRDWMLRNGRLFTFLDPAETTLRTVVTGMPDVLPAGDWLADEQKHRDFVRLLNRALTQDVAPDCTHHSGRDVLYFKATPDLKHRKIVGGTGQARLVFHVKHNKQGKVSYYKHAALRWQFLHLDGDWVCALTPEAHYTRDGRQDSRFYSDLLAGLKRLDRNLAVLGHIRMWAAYLRGEDTLLEQDRHRILDFGSLLTFDTGLGINDADWLADHRAALAPASVESTILDPDTPSLFDEVS